MTGPEHTGVGTYVGFDLHPGGTADKASIEDSRA